MSQPKVLLVDDNPQILERAAASLARGCLIVGAVSDGPSALAAVESLHPDVLVLDISMRGMSGFEVAGRLRSAGSRIPIIFLTVHDDADLVQAAEDNGGSGYVVKPRLMSDLPIAVTEALAGRRYTSQL